MRDLDVAGPRYSKQFGDHRPRIGHVLEHVCTDRVVERSIGERHRRCIGIEDGTVEDRSCGPRSLGGVFGSEVAVEQHVGSPMRLVTAADVEDQIRRGDRDGDPSAMERAQPPDHGSRSAVTARS